MGTEDNYKKYPAFNEYQAALQHPSRCLTPEPLKICSPEADLWGLPRVRSGGFALTYKLSDGESTWALRCFHKHVPDREDRYLCINKYIQTTKTEYFENIYYVREGITIKGNTYPITYMKWVEGETLETFVIRHLEDTKSLSELTQKFCQLVFDLETRKLTHGDLSHHNIMVKNDRLVLVDYDGMNVPAMRQKLSCEIGNPNFQHPGRDETLFNLTTDRFSSIVIFLALKTLSIDPRFWFSYETGGEGLLFRRSDFEHPFQSALLQEMETVGALTRYVHQFRQICVSDVRQIPRLEDFIGGLEYEPIVNEIDMGSTKTAPTIVLDAQKKYLFNSRLGEITTVAGKIEEVFEGKTRDGIVHVFLNFGNWRLKCFTVVLWDEALSLMNSTGLNPQDYLDKWVSVTGMLTSYKRRPQMIVNTPFDIEILDEVKVTEKIAISSPFWFSGKIDLPIKKVRIRQPGSDTTEVKKNPEVAVVVKEKSPSKKKLQAQVANPLDLSTEVVEKIDTLYRKPKDSKKTLTRKKRPKKS